MLTFRPISDGYVELVASPSGSHYANVDDETPDDASSTVGTNSSSAKFDSYSVNTGTLPGDILNVKVYAVCKTNGSGNCRPAIIKPAAGWQRQGSLQALTGSFASYYSEFTVDPWTDLPFERDAFDTYQIGLDLQGDGTYYSFCTQLYLVILCKSASGQVRIIGMEM